MKKSLLLPLLFGVFFANAQTLRPDVLVIGNGNAAVAAAIQAAQSNVKTVLVLQAGGFDINPIDEDLHGGVQAEFLKKARIFKKLSDSTRVAFDKQTANSVLTQWTDSIKNLTVVKNTMWLKASRSGNGWYFKLSDGKAIRPEVFVNVGDTKLNAALKIDPPSDQTWASFDYNNPIYKTNIATGKNVNGSLANSFSLSAFLLPKQENLVYVTEANSMLAGQSAGAVAAYAGFFNSKTSDSNLKKIQGELIAFNTNLIPFVDVPVNDKNWKAIQFVGITGVLKAEMKQGNLVFNPDALVSTAEIRQAMMDHFYKAQIWFDDYRSEVITIGAALDMVCYVGNKALESTRKLVEKKWNSNYGFNGAFDPSLQISRRQLAVLLHEFCPPFNVTVNAEGKIIR